MSLKGSVANWGKKIQIVRKRMGKSKIKDCNKMKKVVEKFSPIRYTPTKSVELKHNFYTLDFDDKPNFDERLNEKSIFNDWYESGFDEELNQEVVKESGEYLTLDYCFESEFEGREDDKGLCEKPTFDYCYESLKKNKGK